MPPTIGPPSILETTEARGTSDGLPPPVSLPDDLQSALLSVARTALAMATGAGRPPARQQALHMGPAGAGHADELAAAFVTLTVDGMLRGCMGSLQADRPIGEAVAVSAVLAATSDPRFREVRAEELPGIHVEVSILGPCVPLRDISCFRPGIDGVIVERGGRRGLLLPEVATTFGWGAVEMLDAVCAKAGLGRRAWQDGRSRVFAFRTARFGGPAVDATRPHED